MSAPLSVEKSLAGRHILFTGGSGFLGKVWLSMMLDKVPNVGRIYVLLRGKKGQAARERFERMVSESYAFKPLHDRHGEDLSRFLSERVEVISGDVSVPGLGVDPTIAQRIQKRLDLVVHCAGQVDFNPELSDALANNIEGTIHAAEFASKAQRAGFVQVSTCFVAGNREGRILEQATPNYAPTREGFDVEAEYLHLKQLVLDIHEETTSERALAELRKELVQSVTDKGHDPNNHQLIDRILRREEKARLSDRLVDDGKKRAQHWGWPNVYTFSKSMAESMLLTRFPNLPKVFFRPAIIESAVSFPLSGWNEGLNTSGPLVYFTGTWFRHLPARKDKPLDVVPVDYCCAALVAASAALVEGCAAPVYQCATSDRHPLTVGRGLELTSLAHRKHFRKHGEDAIERVILSRWDSKVVSDDHPINVDNMRKVAQKVAELAKDVPAGWPSSIKKSLRQLASKSDRVDRKLMIVDKVIDTYKPFVSDNRQTFSCDELVGLEVQEPFFHYEPRNLDWRRYWIDQHVPGLRRWSFPVIDNTKVELYRPKVPVRLVEARASAREPNLEARASAREPHLDEADEPSAKPDKAEAPKKRTRAAKAPEDTRMTIFLTGATGYIGSYIAHGLLGEHRQRLSLLVRAKNKEEGAKRLWQSLQMHMDFATFEEHLSQRVDIYLGDLTDRKFGLDDASYDALVHATSSIIHCAASLNRKSNKACFNVNLRGTLEVLKLARAAQDHHGLRRFSDVSTVAVTGEVSHQLIREDQAIDWNKSDYDPYSRTKKFCEHMVHELLPEVPITVFRPSTVLGDSRYAPTTQFDMVRAFVFLAKLPVLPLHEAWRMDIVPANYVGAGVVAVHMQDRPEHDAYNLSTGVASPTYRQIVDAMHSGGFGRRHVFAPGLVRSFEKTVDRLMDTPKQWGVAPAASLMKVFLPYLTYDTVFDNSRIQKVLGAAPVPFTDYCFGLFKFATESNFKYPYKPWPADAAQAGRRSTSNGTDARAEA